MLLLVVLAVAIAYMDRVNIAIAAPFLKKSLGISNAEMGTCVRCLFLVLRCHADFLLGRMIDRFGIRISCGLAVLWWSIWTTMTGLTNSVASLFVSRLFLGAGGPPLSARILAEGHLFMVSAWRTRSGHRHL